MAAITLAEAALASEVSTIARDTIEVRSLCLPSSQDEIERLATYLSASERERAARFHFKADYDRHVAGRAALRLQLGALLNRDPKSLSLQTTNYGKPFMADCGVAFNLSHSGDWMLFAFSRSTEIGVDIEHVRPLSDMREIAKQNFSPSEFARWQAIPEWDRTEAFYRCWTRKESFIKAMGEGLSCALETFEVAFDLNRPARLTSLHGDEALAASWWMADLSGFAGYAAAVTARSGHVETVRLRVRELAIADLLG